MSRSATYVACLVLVICLVTSPTSANWFGKRGDKADLISMLLQHHTQQSRTSPVSKSPSFDRLTTAYHSSPDLLDSVAALSAIENVITSWKQQSEKSIQH